VVIDVQVFVLPASLDVRAAERLIEGDRSASRFLDGVDVMRYSADASSPAPEDASDVGEAALREHAGRWMASFVNLVQAHDRSFEYRIAHRVPVVSGGEMLVVAFDLDGAHDPWYEDVFTLAVMHYAPIARAMGVRLPGEFLLDVR
jgi:hypothetical protein